MELTGLMAPAGSKARRDYDEAARRAAGWGGLLSAVAEPLSYLPGPVGTVAEVAGNIGEQGPMQGLMASWDVVGLPKVLRQGPKVLKMFERVPVNDPKLERALKILSKDVMSPQARELQAKTGRVVDIEGNLLEEISDAGAAVKTRLFDALDEVQRRTDPRYVASARASDFFSHPELFRRHPEMADMPVRLQASPKVAPGKMGGSFNPVNKDASLLVPPEASANDIKRALETWLHEGQHYLQQKGGLQGGASHQHIKDLLADAVAHYAGDQPPWLDPKFEQAFKRAALKRYADTEGELWARAVEERRNLPEAMLRKIYPYDTQKAYGYTSPIPQAERVLQPYNQSQIELIARRLLGIPEGPP